MSFKPKKTENQKYSVFFLGDSQTGKTTIISKYFDLPIDYNCQISTIRIDYYKKTIEVNNKTKIDLKIYDTAGQEQYRSNAFQIIKTKCNGIIILYSINSKKSFNNVFEYWIDQLNNIIDLTSIPIYIVGNKCDLKDEREVEKEEVENKLKEYDFKFMETSAKKNINISELFKNISEDIYKKYYKEEKQEINNISSKNSLSKPFEVVNIKKPKRNIFSRIFNFIGHKIKKIFKKKNN